MRINEIISAFSLAGSEEARTEAYLTLEFLFGVSRGEIVAHYEREYDEAKIKEVIKKREAKIPLQYIFGEWYFMGNRFIVSEKCLIPRPDTEILVSKAIDSVKKQARVVDLCTGSGCIAISLLALRKDLTADAYDISDGALRIAEENAKRNGVADRISFQKADLLSLPSLPRTYGAILSNPPYIRTRDLPSLSPEVQKEPRLALDGGHDGLMFYRHFVSAFRASLSENGLFLFEIGFDQGDDLNKIAKGSRMSCEILKDYGGCDRVAILM